MDYTEKEKKGIKKVESMNSFFDKVLMPAIGVIIVIILISFIVGNLKEKFGKSSEDVSSTVSAISEEPIEFSLRAAVMSEYEKYSSEFNAYGYEKADGYSQELALCKIVDEELVIFQFKDTSMGYFTILRYEPQSTEVGYSSLSMTVSSSSLINVAVKAQDTSHKVTFTSVDFASHTDDDDAQYDEMMQMISVDDLTALYEIFKADIDNLAETCGISQQS